MGMGFLDKLPKTEVIPGITKYTLKVDESVPIVEFDSHISCMRHHRTREGCWEKPNNVNYQQGRKVKLAGQGDAELIACLRTMRLGEIAYFFVERDLLDKTLPDLNSETLTADEKKKLASDRMLDGYNRLEIVDEKKIQRQVAGVSESIEDRLKHIATCKSTADAHFKNFEYEKACKEYMKGFNLSTQFPVKKAEDEKKTEVVAELRRLRRDIINNCLKASFKAKNLKYCQPLFEEKVFIEMQQNFTYIDCIATIWVESTSSDSIAMDVSSLIEYLEKYINSDLPTPEQRKAIEGHLRKLRKYERSVNILGNLSSYTQRAEEFEREQKIAEKIRLAQKESESAPRSTAISSEPKAEANQN